jgi:hypothetical protein
MYRELGASGLGAILSCNRDGAFCTGFNPAIRLTRTQTIMAGADYCDFRFSIENASAADPAKSEAHKSTQSDQLGADDGERSGE